MEEYRLDWNWLNTDSQTLTFSEPSNQKVCFTTLHKNIIEVSYDGVVKVNGEETKDPLIIGEALLEWASSLKQKQAASSHNS